MNSPKAYDPETAAKIVTQFAAKPELLVQILHEYMRLFAFISEEAVRQIADALNLSVAEVFGVVHFYDDFRTEAPGKHTVKICQAESCQAMGSRELTNQAEQLLDTKLNSTSADGNITLDAVYCLGNCACSPSIMVDEKIYGRVNSETLANLINSGSAS